MINRHKSIRTYQKKTVKKSLLASSGISLAPSVVLTRTNNCTEKIFLDNYETSNNSMGHDPFETTFDRIAKGVVVPSLPMDTNQNNSWNSNSSDNDNNTSFVKSPELAVSNISPCKGKPSLTYKTIKHIRKCRRQQKCEPEIVVSKKILSKRVKAKIKNEIQSRTKIQEQRRQTNKVQKKKIIQYKSKKPSLMCNERIFHSDINNLTNEYRNNITCNYDKHLYQSIIKINKNSSRMSQNTSNQANNSNTTFKPILNYQIIRPCFVKLDSNVVRNWYILNHEKITENKQNILHNLKLSYVNILQDNKDNSQMHNIILQSISNDYNNIIEDFKHTSIKPCYVVLSDVIKNGNILKNKRDVNDFINAENKLNASHLHNLLETISHNTTVDITFDMKKDRRNLTKRSFVKVKKLDMKHHVKKKHMIFKKKEKNMISSTPIGKYIKPTSILLSPIDTNICNTLNWKYENSMVTVEENNSIIASNKISEQKDFSCALITSECSKIHTADTHKQQIQVLLSPQELPITDFTFKTETMFSDDNHDTRDFENDNIIERYNTKYNTDMRLMHSLNVSTGTDQSQSLFDDTTHNQSEKDIRNNIEKRHFIDMLEHESAKMDMAVSLHSPLDLNLKQEQLLNNNACTDVNKENISSKKCVLVETESFQSLDNIAHTKQIHKSQEKRNTEIGMMKEMCENFKDKITDDNKHSFCKSQNNINAANVHMLLAQLQDPIRITGRRIQYSKWHRDMSNTFENLSNESAISNNNKVFHHVAMDRCSNILPMISNFEYPKNAINLPLDHFKLHDVTQQYNNDINIQIEKSIFLKPGKCWSRSLSILNNVNPESNLNKLSIGKGKKWRHSVRNILNMQKQGIFQSCLKEDQSDMDLPCGGFDASNISPFGENKRKFDSTNHGRFSKRISIRVVPESTNINCDIEDVPFLEAFGITPLKENGSSQLKVSYEKKSLIRNIEHDNDDRITGSQTTAKDVVLQKCSQTYYLPFSEYFSDLYLDHCCKIGEGVYGEVFLYKYRDKKSVVKIIPIEGEELVNGEPQKKFNEILSEIVIVKELHNLRSHATCKTNGFIEVKNIKCIIGKYPKKLIELWNIYDDNKTSDNDCPSMFGENQLYIALELGYGGEDLEAFIFQTAQEACAVFLQTALTLAVAEKAFEFEHRDLHWGNILISRTKESYIYYNLDGKDIKFPSNGIKVSIIDFTLSRMLYQECCIYNDLALDPALFNAHGEYQFEIYRLMRDKIQNNWRKFEPYTNILWLHYILDKMITMVRYKKKNLKTHKHAIIRLKEFKDMILNYDSAFNFINNSDSVMCL